MKREKLLISAHVDGEIEAPWAQKFDRFIESDEKWLKEAELHRKVKDALKTTEEGSLDEAKARVWGQIQARIAADSYTNAKPTPLEPKRVRFVSWKPLTAAAAALLLFFSLGLGYLLGNRGNSATGDVAEFRVDIPKQFDLQDHGESQLIQLSNYKGTKP